MKRSKRAASASPPRGPAPPPPPPQRQIPPGEAEDNMRIVQQVIDQGRAAEATLVLMISLCRHFNINVEEVLQPILNHPTADAEDESAPSGDEGSAAGEDEPGTDEERVVVYWGRRIHTDHGGIMAQGRSFPLSYAWQLTAWLATEIPVETCAVQACETSGRESSAVLKQSPGDDIDNLCEYVEFTSWTLKCLVGMENWILVCKAAKVEIRIRIRQSPALIGQMSLGNMISRALIVCVAALVAVVVHGSSGEASVDTAPLFEENDPNVVILTDNNFNALVRDATNGVPWLILFHHSSSLHCKIIAPIYQDVAVTLNSLGGIIHVGAINCKDSDQCALSNIHGFPTISLWHFNQTGNVEHKRVLGAHTKPELLRLVLQFFQDREFNATGVWPIDTPPCPPPHYMQSLLRQAVRVHTPLLNAILRSIWIVLSTVAAGSTIIPFLRHLSLHGRMQSSSSIFQVSKRWFGWFYLVGWVWNAFVFACATPWGPITPFATPSGPTCLVLVLQQCHLFRRMMESFAITQFGASTMHVSVLALGMGHYILVSLSIVLDDGAARSMSYTPLDMALVAAGVVLFVVASIHQTKCNAVLALLKQSHEPKTDDGSSSSSRRRYGLPTGDWFKWIWSPLYLAEILIYLSFALVTQGRNHNLLFAVLWVAVNQTISAARAKAWYETTFPAAAPRAALVPCLW
ncbi:Aste57867_21436 [Aphanomyces stellatus]|uniref:Aste57867_21436 protein n=1 Tax=Aphanomyces stellatus TaxID=120398 RepID=A0A485LJL5_9STRA|nr:hypothetical protein As57867_021367 [Aphanomyces stellatus]VFT98107.1 Aste57867_21436 [Aphanomyces stellatus]